MRIVLAAAFAALLIPAARAQQTPHFPSDAPLGAYDKAALQRGYLVYQTDCASCHSLNALHYRDLSGIGLDSAQIAGLAAGVKLSNGPAAMDDRFKNPYPDHAAAAAAFGGAVPPDLSSFAASVPHGTRYIYRLLTGYTQAPAGVTLRPGHYYDPAFPGNETAMPPPLRDAQVSYADGTRPSAAQEAADVSAFLSWAADPNLDARKEIGLRVVLFLLFLAGLAIATKRRIWRQTA